MKAIETSYKGYRFRSRLEARWAVFFDAVNIVWRYEVEGYTFDSGLCYLPDFYLPAWDTHLEVKPDLPYGDLERVDSDSDSDGGWWLPFGTGSSLEKFLAAAASMNVPWVPAAEGAPPRPAKNKILMLCGTPGVPDLRWKEDRWELADGAVLLSAPIDGFDMWAWADPGDTSTDLWPVYLREGTTTVALGPLTGKCYCSPVFPASHHIRAYLGGNRRRSFDSPRLKDAYRRARSARFEHGESGGCR